MYDIISCNPYEEKEDILKTIELLLKLPKPYFLSVNNLIFFEGTPLYHKALQDGTIKDGRDSASDLNYWDRWKHIKLKRKNAYLNLVLNMMRGVVTDTRYGVLPAGIVKLLVRQRMVDFNLKHKTPTYMAGQVVQVVDNLRENVAKPLFRSMPVSFKVWYDQVRYKA